MTEQALRYKLNFERFDLLTKSRGWKNDTQRALGIGVSHTTIRRLRKGELSPGLTFIGKATSSLGVDVEDLFDRVDAGAPDRQAA